MKSGFHQMEIDEGSKHITAFITPDGLYEYHRMPFGLVNAPAVYQRAIDKALGKLKGTEAHVYMDDVLIPSESIEEGRRSATIRECITRFSQCRVFIELS
jgi:hypothetical protein